VVDFTAGEDVAFAQGFLANIFDVVIDVASTRGDTTSKTTTVLPPSVKITFTDSLLTDGDGLEYTIVFGKIDSTTRIGGSPCIDERTRAGSLYITQSDYFNNQNVKITVEMRDDATSHYVGGSGDMAKFVGTLVIQRTNGRGFTLNTTNCFTNFNGGTTKITAAQTITFLADVSPGIWGQSYNTTGKINGTSHTGENFTSFIGVTLVKKIASGCCRTFAQGKIEVTNTTKDNISNVDYDPNLDGACDRLFKISLIDGQSQTYKVN
jgi:hypothetical protein